MSREIWYCCPNFIIEISEVEGELHAHCRVKKWSPSVLKRLYIEFVMLRQDALGRGYTEMYSISPNPKFCELFGAESIGTNGDYEVMRWDLTLKEPYQLS